MEGIGDHGLSPAGELLAINTGGRRKVRFFSFLKKITYSNSALSFSIARTLIHDIWEVRIEHG